MGLRGKFPGYEGFRDEGLRGNLYVRFEGGRDEKFRVYGMNC